MVGTITEFKSSPPTQTHLHNHGVAISEEPVFIIIP